MADLTTITLERNAGTAVALETGAADQDMIHERDDMILLVYNQDDGGHEATVTIKAGEYHMAVLGDLEVAIPAGDYAIIGPLESARFKTEAGDVNVDIAIAAGGVVTDVLLSPIAMP